MSRAQRAAAPGSGRPKHLTEEHKQAISEALLEYYRLNPKRKKAKTRKQKRRPARRLPVSGRPRPAAPKPKPGPSARGGGGVVGTWNRQLSQGSRSAFQRAVSAKKQPGPRLIQDRLRRDRKGMLRIQKRRVRRQAMVTRTPLRKRINRVWRRQRRR